MQKNKSRPQLLFIFSLLFILMVVVGCGSDSSTRISFQTGILNGVIIFWEGDFMPGSPTGTKTPVKRELYIFEETTLDMVEQQEPGPFYSKVNSRLVEVTRSNMSGIFQVKLPPRIYSIFIKEGELFYANGADLYGRIMPAEIKSNSSTWILLDITYMATF